MSKSLVLQFMDCIYSRRTTGQKKGGSAYFEMSGAVDRKALGKHCGLFRMKLMNLFRTGGHRRNAKEQNRKHSAFIPKPYGFSVQLQGQKCNSHPTCSRDQAFHSTYRDAAKELDLVECGPLVDVFHFHFNTKELGWNPRGWQCFQPWSGV